MAVEVVGKTKRVFEFKGIEYQTVEEVKAAMLVDELGTDPVVPAQLLNHGAKLVDILRYNGRKSRTPKPPGWVAPPKKARKARKGKGGPEATA